MFKHWYLTYRANHDGQSPTDLINEFTTDIFDDFMLQQVEETYQAQNNPTPQIPSTPMPTTPFSGHGGVINTPTPTTMTHGAQNLLTKVFIKDYPQFNESFEKWRSFWDQFLSAADFYGYRYILEPGYVIPSLMDPEHANFLIANRVIHMALTYSVSNGLACTHVTRYRTTKDGSHGW